ncbi:MAG: GSCFA domain-containing protein [Bacteroidetes bacterium]|nr:GSCFA domain-containing protein [Bacteroidota bacterium]
MKFHLDYQVPKAAFQLEHRHSLLLVGSCFTEHIGHYLQSHKFNALCNPFGLMFNPASICQALQRIINNTPFRDQDLIFHQDTWYAWEAHGIFSHSDKSVLLSQLNDSMKLWQEAILTANYLILTPGTAFVYRHMETGLDVANCHKVPQKEFQKYLMTSEQVVNAFSEVIIALHKLNPQLEIIFTVSPVKHLRDGMIENNLSKAILIQAVHELCYKMPSCSYFPAYELVIDDLRDYRFFETDMAHPNKQAIEYVWKKFSKAYFSDCTEALNQRIEDIVRATWHKPLKPDSVEFKKFKEAYSLKCSDLVREYPFLDLKHELAHFSM